MPLKRVEERWRREVAATQRKRREISLYAGRHFRRSESGRENRPAPFEMTGGRREKADPSRRGGLGMTSGEVAKKTGAEGVAEKRNGRYTEVRRPFLIFVK